MRQNPPRRGIKLTDQQRLDWLRLIRSENVGPATFADLINCFGTANEALKALPDLAKKAGRRKIRIAASADCEMEMRRTLDKGARIICLGEPDYPPALRQVDSPPPVLSIAGSGETLTKPAIAFVGSRNASLSGIKFTKQLARETGQAGYTITSGLARGIDAAAHEASLTTGTVAVFAGGIDHIYPHQNKKLAHDIVDNGGTLITEMPFGWKPRAQDFPRRNRIVAGMALGLVVVEANRRSGSLISANLANEAGRLVFAVPGSPLDQRSEGANYLIQQGATLITSAQDILEAVNPLQNSSPNDGLILKEQGGTSFTASPSQTDRETLLQAIGHTPTEIDELIRFTGLHHSTVQLLVLEMILAGTLERHSGNRVSIIAKGDMEL